MTASPPVFILLLNYRGAEHTLACLDSLQMLDYPDYRIIVIDNASLDDSVARLKTRLKQNPDEFHLIESSENLGFSGGNNLGIDYALAQSKSDERVYVWLLNNDTTVAPDALRHLVAEAQKTGGLAGSLLLYPDERYQQVGSRIHWLTGSVKGYPESAVQDGMAVDSLIGASMLVPLEVIRRAGKLDPSFFLYFEDAEYSVRARQHGYRLTVSSQSRVFHAEGATTGRKSLQTQYYYHRNRLHFLALHASPLHRLTTTLYTIFRMARSVVKSLWSSDPERRVSAQVQWLALRDFWRGIRGKCPHNLESMR